jgi:hypothetical protein
MGPLGDVARRGKENLAFLGFCATYSSVTSCEALFGVGIRSERQERLYGVSAVNTRWTTLALAFALCAMTVAIFASKVMAAPVVQP